MAARATRAREGHIARASTFVSLTALLAIAALASTGCSSSEGDASIGERSATTISDHECSVCGMLVRDQPAPRAQVLHRDGTPAFACSVGDVLVHLSAPSPHGRASNVWVEVMEPTQSPDERATHAHRWLPAADAWYVVGVERRGIMGPPVLAYAELAHAESAAGLHDSARVLDWAGLEAWWSDLHR